MNAHAEPIYEFVKGKGWITGYAPVLWTGIVKWSGRSWNITIIKRPPSEGEHGWNCRSHFNRENELVFNINNVGIISYPWDTETEIHWGWPLQDGFRKEILEHPEWFVTVLQEEIT